jgi:NAD-dependent DNA ligase
MKKVKIITNCPSCSEVLTRVKDQLFCKNSNCLASQSKKVLHFIKTMKIKGLGEKTVEKLNIETIEDIYNLTEEYIIKVMGDKIGPKLFKEIEFSKKTNVEKILPAFSIYLIGTAAAKKLYSVVSNIDDITFDICKQAGLGDVATKSLMTWIDSSYPEFKNLPLTFEAKTQSTESRNIKVCITGKLNDYRSRALASSYLESKGITVVSGVSKSLDYLICEDNKPSSKLSKAKSYNIPIIGIKQLIEEKLK